MQIVSKVFDDIKVGDTAELQTTLQPKDLRAWASPFSDGAGGAGADPAGIVSALLSSLARS